MGKIEHYSEIKHYIQSKIVQTEDAEDLTQQVFLEYLKAENRKSNPQNTKAYLFGTARIMVADYYRQKKKQPQLVQFNPKFTDKKCEAKHISDSDMKEISEEVNNIISLLPPKAKEAVELILLNNLRYEEAAKRANCSIRIFYERFYKGLRIIKKIMNP